MAALKTGISVKGKIKENDLLGMKKQEWLVKEIIKLIEKDLGTTSINSTIAEIFNFKKTSKLLSQQIRANFDPF